MKTYKDVTIAQDEANDQHYTCPTEYFDLVLGKYKKYSCCIWDDCKDLEEAEIKTLQLYCDMLELDSLPDGAGVLDIGCGWGSFTRYASEKYQNLKFTCISNSPTQKVYIDGFGHKNVTCMTLDLGKAKNLDGLKGSYARAISIEMFEHMKRYDILLKTFARLLEPDGKMLVHIFVNDRYNYEFTAETGWMARNFFTGGNMPSKNLLFHFQDDMHITTTKTINGSEYSKTLEAWCDRHIQYKEEIVKIFEKYEPGQGLAKWNAWWMFYIACSVNFGFDSGSGEGNEWFVQLYLFKNHSK